MAAIPAIRELHCESDYKVKFYILLFRYKTGKNTVRVNMFSFEGVSMKSSAGRNQMFAFTTNDKNTLHLFHVSPESARQFKKMANEKEVRVIWRMATPPAAMQ